MIPKALTSVTPYTLPPASPPKDVDMDKLSPGKVYTRKKLAFNVLHAGEAAELRIVTAVAKANVVLQRGSGVVLENLPLKDIRSWVRHANGVVLNVDVLAKSGKVKTDARIVAMECVGGEDPRVITDALVRNCGCMAQRASFTYRGSAVSILLVPVLSTYRCYASELCARTQPSVPLVLDSEQPSL